MNDVRRKSKIVFKLPDGSYKNSTDTRSGADRSKSGRFASDQDGLIVQKSGQLGPAEVASSGKRPIDRPSDRHLRRHGVGVGLSLVHHHHAVVRVRLRCLLGDLQQRHPTLIQLVRDEEVHQTGHHAQHHYAQVTGRCVHHHV